MRLSLFLALTLTLVACEKAPESVAPAADAQAAAAVEIEALSQGSVVVGMMADYHVLRQQARACGSAETGRHG